MEAPQQNGGGGVWPSLGMPAPLVTPGSSLPSSWRLSSTEGKTFLFYFFILINLN
jgi:hypothetical protein